MQFSSLQLTIQVVTKANIKALKFANYRWGLGLVGPITTCSSFSVCTPPTAPTITHLSFNCPESWLTHLQFTPTITSRWPLVSFCFPGSPTHLLSLFASQGNVCSPIIGAPSRFPGVASSQLGAYKGRSSSIGLAMLPNSPQGSLGGYDHSWPLPPDKEGVKKITASPELADCQSSCHLLLGALLAPYHRQARSGSRETLPVLKREVPVAASSSCPGRPSWRRRKTPHDLLLH